MSNCQSRYKGLQCFRVAGHEEWDPNHCAADGGSVGEQWTDAQVDASPEQLDQCLWLYVDHTGRQFRCGLKEEHEGWHVDRSTNGVFSWAPTIQPCTPGCEHERRAEEQCKLIGEYARAVNHQKQRIAELEEERKGMRLTYNLRDPVPHERAALSRAYQTLAHLCTTGTSLSVEDQRTLRECVATIGKTLGDNQ